MADDEAWVAVESVAFELLMAALRHHQAGDLAEARRGYEQVLGAEPRNADALHLLGVIELQSGRPDIGLERVRAALSISAGAAAYHDSHGSALRALGRLEEAVAAYRRALDRDGGLAPARFNLAGTLMQLGRLDAAAVEYRHFLRLIPEHAGAAGALAGTLASLGRTREAEAAYRHVLVLTPDAADALGNLGALSVRAGRPAFATAPLRRAIRLAPDRADAHNALGHALHSLGAAGAAALAYRRALALTPALTGALNNLGTLEKERGESGQAYTLFGRAVVADPDHAEAAGNAANVLLTGGRTEDARRLLERALALDPTGSAFLAELSRTDMALGRPDRAAAACRRLKAAAPADLNLLDPPMAALAEIAHDQTGGLTPDSLVRVLLDTGLAAGARDPYAQRALVLGTWFAAHYGCALPEGMAADGAAVFARARAGYALASANPGPRRRREVRRVAFVTNQLLALLHSPTRLLLRWARLAAQHAGTDVMVVALGDPRSAGYAAEHRQAMGGAPARFVYADTALPEVMRDRALLDALQGYDPDLVAVLSDDTLVEDHLYDRWPVLRLSVAMSFPYSRFDTITSIFDDDKIRACWRAQGWPEERVARHERMACTPIDLPAPTAPRARATLGLEEDAVVIVTVGNRLHTEIDAGFARMMFAHLEAHPNSRWLLVGTERFPLPEFAGHPLAGRCRYLAYERDLNALYGVCDVYANPDRAGGGLSAFWAMAQGVPVLTLDTLSDTAMCVPRPWRMRDAGHYAAALADLAGDALYRRALGAGMAEAARVFAAPETFASEFRRLAELTVVRFNRRVEGT
ncbi:MAG TPA: tetratricopeptide repeat protein [Azospirillum sp.]|nr:tetratricopeptide repeat protein [Azospirillum sp.]